MLPLNQDRFEKKKMYWRWELMYDLNKCDVFMNGQIQYCEDANSTVI